MHYENDGDMKFLNEQNTLHYIRKNGRLSKKRALIYTKNT